MISGVLVIDRLGQIKTYLLTENTNLEMKNAHTIKSLENLDVRFEKEQTLSFDFHSDILELVYLLQYNNLRFYDLKIKVEFLDDDNQQTILIDNSSAEIAKVIISISGNTKSVLYDFAGSIYYSLHRNSIMQSLSIQRKEDTYVGIIAIDYYIENPD